MKSYLENVLPEYFLPVWMPRHHQIFKSLTRQVTKTADSHVVDFHEVRVFQDSICSVQVVIMVMIHKERWNEFSKVSNTLYTISFIILRSVHCKYIIACGMRPIFPDLRARHSLHPHTDQGFHKSSENLIHDL